MTSVTEGAALRHNGPDIRHDRAGHRAGNRVVVTFLARGPEKSHADPNLSNSAIIAPAARRAAFEKLLDKKGV